MASSTPQENSPDAIVSSSADMRLLGISFLLCFPSIVAACLSQKLAGELIHPLLIPIIIPFELTNFLLPLIILIPVLFWIPVVRSRPRVIFMISILFLIIGLLLKYVSHVDEHGIHSLRVLIHFCMSVSFALSLLSTLASLIKLGNKKQAISYLILAQSLCSIILCMMGLLAQQGWMTALVIVFTILSLFLCHYGCISPKVEPEHQKTSAMKTRANFSDFAATFSVIMLIGCAFFDQFFAQNAYFPPANEIQLLTCFVFGISALILYKVSSFLIFSLFLYIGILLIMLIALPSSTLWLSLGSDYSLSTHWPHHMVVALSMIILCSLIAAISHKTPHPMMTLTYGYGLCFIAFYSCFFLPIIIVFCCVFILLPIYLEGMRGDFK